MNYRTLGTSALQVSEIGFGCMSLRPQQTDAIQLLQQAMAAGINYYDTADLYDQGENEKLLAKAIGTRRQSVIIATKGGNQWQPGVSGWSWNASPAYLVQAVENSLQRLNTDYIDLYQLHGGTLEDPIDDIIDAFNKLRSQGKIRYYGISSIRPAVIRAWLSRGITSVMMQYSLLDRRPEESALPLLAENNTGMLARGVLAKGLLAGKTAEPFLNYTAEQVAEAAKAVQALSSPVRCAASVATRFALQQATVSSAVVGIRNQLQLNQAIEASLSTALTKEEWNMLAAVLPANLYDAHR